MVHGKTKHPSAQPANVRVGVEAPDPARPAPALNDCHVERSRDISEYSEIALLDVGGSSAPRSMFTAQSGFNRPLSSETFREQAADPAGAISGPLSSVVFQFRSPPTRRGGHSAIGNRQSAILRWHGPFQPASPVRLCLPSSDLFAHQREHVVFRVAKFSQPKIVGRHGRDQHRFGFEMHAT
jgi:hypothetical protein